MRAAIAFFVSVAFAGGCSKPRDEAASASSSASSSSAATTSSAHAVDETGVAEIAFGASKAVCARKRSGMIRCWGPGPSEVRDDLGQPIGDADQLAVSDSTRCVRVVDGTVSCWGRDIGTGRDQPMPTRVDGLAGVREVGTKDDFGCARTKDKVLCWGDDSHGKMGDWNGPARAAPTVVPGVDGAQQLAVGIVHSCAVVGRGSVVCWGSNRDGQLGDGSKDVRKAPVAVHGVGSATVVGVGLKHSCALLGDGSVQCWGGGALGEIGDGAATDRPSPTRVKGLSGVVEIAVGHSHACARTEKGGVSCWGANDHGQCGRPPGSPDHLAAPSTVPDVKATKIAAGGHHTCAWVEGGEVRCWGESVPGAGDSGKPVKVAW